MNYSLKEAFDSIKAESKLKDNTYAYLIKEISMQNQKKKNLIVPKLLYTSVACLFLFFFGFQGYSIYFKQTALVSIDVNPSIELSLNRFDRVISYKAYNRESEKILNSVTIKNKNYKDAIEILMSNKILDYYITDNSYISFAVQSDNTKKEEILLSKIESCADNYLSSHHQNSSIEIEYSQVDTNLTQEAHNHGVSVGKYKAILELQEVNPNVTVEECKHKSLKELKTASYNTYEEETNNKTNNRINGNCHNNGRFRHHHH